MWKINLCGPKHGTSDRLISSPSVATLPCEATVGARRRFLLVFHIKSRPRKGKKKKSYSMRRYLLHAQTGQFLCLLDKNVATSLNIFQETFFKSILAEQSDVCKSNASCKLFTLKA